MHCSQCPSSAILILPLSLSVDDRPLSVTSQPQLTTKQATRSSSILTTTSTDPKFAGSSRPAKKSSGAGDDSYPASSRLPTSTPNAQRGNNIIIINNSIVSRSLMTAPRNPHIKIQHSHADKEITSSIDNAPLPPSTPSSMSSVPLSNGRRR